MSMPMSVPMDMEKCFVPRTVSCKFVMQALFNYLDDRLDPEALAHIGKHLRLCRRCSVLMDSARRILKIATGGKVFLFTPGQSEQLYIAARRKLEIRSACHLE